MEEVIVLEEGNVKVTTARFVVDGQTYAMNGVTSVRQFEKTPPIILPIIIGIVGFGTLFGQALVGLVIIGIAVAIWKMMKASHSVILATASGASTALTSKDKGHIERVVAALNDAIVKR